VLFAPAARAECTPQWQSMGGLPGVDGTVSAATMWDPDGAGPLPPRLVLGGRFTIAGNVFANNTATWDGTTWTPLGSGIDGALVIYCYVSAFATLPNGDLVAGGSFITAGGVTCNGIARWNGAAWAPLGSGMNGVVRTLVTLPNGDLVAGGSFTTAGGVACAGIARWNGTAWAPLGSGVAGSLHTVRALAVLPNGDLVAGGQFATAGGVTCNGVARWNGTAWAPLGSGVNYAVLALATLPNGDLVAGGTFYMAGGAICNNIARWDGTVWAALGSGITSSSGSVAVEALITLPNGDVVAGGAFGVAGGVTCNGIARWDGTAWAPMQGGMTAHVGSDPAYVGTLAALPNGGFVAGGSFAGAGGVTCDNVAQWGGAGWAPVGPGIGPAGGYGPQVGVLVTLPNGDVVAGGNFTAVGGATCHYIARWDGKAWAPLGSGMNGVVHAIATLPDGDLIAGGNFTTAGGVSCRRIARWDGTSWTPLGAGLSGGVSGVVALATLPDGDLVAGGDFTSAGRVQCNGISRWDGSAWAPLGTGLSSLYTLSVNALAVLPNGDLVAAGHFDSAGGVPCNNIARWDGASWSPLGSGISSTGNPYPNALAALPNGDLVVAGQFETAGGVPCNNIARWDGASWSPLGPGIGGYLNALATLPNGDLVAGGWFGPPGHFIARWDGTVWSGLGSGMNDAVFALSALPNGDLFAGGKFTAAGGQPSVCVARWGCPALIGDANCDGLANNGDVDAFVLAMTDAAAYIAAFPNCSLLNADINGDGLVNNGDVDAFVTLLTGL
jgi:hypothetical protein